jgi:hypothetical protein
MADEKEVKTPKESTSSKKKTTDNFDDDFEKVETIFPPIFYAENEEGVITLIPQALREGPNGPLMTSLLVGQQTAGSFKRNDEEVKLKDGIFALGLGPTLTGDDKLIFKHDKGERAKLTPLGEYLIDNELPVRLVYKGVQKSKTNKGYKYHVFEFYAHKKAIAATKDSF